MRIGSSNVTMTTVKRSLVKNTKKNDLMTLKKARKNVRAIWTGWQACHVGGSIVSRERHSIMMHPMASGHGDRRSDRRELLRGGHIPPHTKRVPLRQTGRQEPEQLMHTPRASGSRFKLEMLTGGDSNRFDQRITCRSRILQSAQ